MKAEVTEIIERAINEGTTVDPKYLCYFAERIINDLNELKNNENN